MIFSHKNDSFSLPTVWSSDSTSENFIKHISSPFLWIQPCCRPLSSIFWMISIVSQLIFWSPGCSMSHSLCCHLSPSPFLTLPPCLCVASCCLKNKAWTPEQGRSQRPQLMHLKYSSASAHFPASFAGWNHVTRFWSRKDGQKWKKLPPDLTLENIPGILPPCPVLVWWPSS